MKRILCLILLLSLSFGLSACYFNDSGDIIDPVEFYYPRRTADFVYGSPEGVIAPEIREASGHAQDLNYLIAMYLRGPQDKTLRSPFPTGCSLQSIHEEGTTLHISLTSQFASLEGVELTLACACLAKTFLPLTAYTHICIDAASGEESFQMTLDADSIVLADENYFEAPLPEKQPQ